MRRRGATILILYSCWKWEREPQFLLPLVKYIVHACLSYRDSFTSATAKMDHMQQPMGYPVFWTNQAQRPPVLTHASMYPPPLPHFPDFRKKRRKDGTCLYLFIVFLLVLLALVGVGIGTYKIMELQKELDRVKEVQNALFYF